MSRTYRKDEWVKFQEGNPKKLNINYKCRCEWCLGKSKHKAKLHLKQMKKQLQEYNTIG